MKEFQIIIGIILLFFAIFLIFSAFNNSKTSSAGLIMIGPFPIVFGTNEKIKNTLLIIGMIVGIIILIKYLNV